MTLERQTEGYSATSSEIAWRTIRTVNNVERVFIKSYHTLDDVKLYLDWFEINGYRIIETFTAERIEVKKVEEPDPEPEEDRSTVFVHSETGPEDEEEKKHEHRSSSKHAS